MERNPKIVSLVPPTEAAAGLVANRALIGDIQKALLSAPKFLASLGLTEADVIGMAPSGPGDPDLPSAMRSIGSGHYARAFSLPNGLVLKVTDDEDDAIASELIRVANMKGSFPVGLLHVVAVKKFRNEVFEHETDTRYWRSLYAIVSETVMPLRPYISRLLAEIPAAEGVPLKALLGGMAHGNIWTLGKAASDRGLGRDLQALAAALLEEAFELTEKLDEIMQGVKWLADRKIEVTDLHAGNFGRATGGRMVLFDFGHGSNKLLGSFGDETIGMAENSVQERDFYSPKPVLELRDEPSEQVVGMKPRGLWYACDGDWLRWMKDESPDWIYNYEHRYEITPDLSRMLVIRTVKELDAFNRDFGVRRHEAISNIDWARVAAKYDGIEICPYQRDRRTSLLWYYSWDVASGCIWRKRAILDIAEVPLATSDLTENGHAMPHARAAFDECFDALLEQFPDFGELELHQDEKAGSDNGHGSERQFGYCMDGKPIRVAFAAKTEKLPVANIRGLMAHEFGHALDYRYGDKLGKMLGQRLPAGVERRADAVAQAVFGKTIKYDSRDIQCVACRGKSARPRRLGP